MRPSARGGFVMTLLMPNQNADIKLTNDDDAPPGHSRQITAPSALDLLDDTDEADDVDVEMALLSLSAQDMGEPTEAVDLSALSDAEKRALLALLRQRLHLPPAPVAPAPGSEEGTMS